jgi:hypothetical protein
VETEVIDLDALVAQQALTRLDVIKMDVEGAELEVIKGGLKTLEQYKPILLIELFDAALQKQGASVDAVVAQLKEAGYSFYGFSESTGLPHPFERPDASSQNVLAIHRGRSFQQLTALDVPAQQELDERGFSAAC